MIYTSFAQVYDTLMDDTLYTQWRDYVQARVPAAVMSWSWLAAPAAWRYCWRKRLSGHRTRFKRRHVGVG